MHKGDKFQFKYEWWDKERPKALASTGLGAALKTYETAKQKFQANPERDGHKAAETALDAVDAARLKAIKLCIGPAFATEKAVLTAGAHEIAEEKRRLAGLGEAKAQMDAKEIRKLFEDAIKSIQSARQTHAKIEVVLEKAMEHDQLDDAQKVAVEEALKKAVNVVFFLESPGARIKSLRDNRKYLNALYFRVDAALSNDLRDAGKTANEARTEANGFRDDIDSVAARHDLAVKYMATI